MSEATKGKPKILCVDDEANVLDSLDRLLRNDFTVLKATTGEQGLTQLAQHPDCAIILSDYRMPGMNGVDFLKRARNLIPTATRAILSGQIDIDQVSEAINAAEIHRFFLKPWDNEILRLQMLEALQTHSRLSEHQWYQQLSITDPITQLTNHRYFQEKIKRDMEEAQTLKHPLSVIMIDVDHFKSFNDRYGHPEGDRLLAEVAHRLTTHFPEKGTASRYGGEEFIVVLPNMSAERAFEKAEGLRMQMELNAFPGPSGRPAYVTVSLGVATFPDHAKTSSDLVTNADRALYEAKRQGRNKTLIFNPQTMAQPLATP